MAWYGVAGHGMAWRPQSHPRTWRSSLSPSGSIGPDLRLSPSVIGPAPMRPIGVGRRGSMPTPSPGLGFALFVGLGLSPSGPSRLPAALYPTPRHWIPLPSVSVQVCPCTVHRTLGGTDHTGLPEEGTSVKVTIRVKIRVKIRFRAKLRTQKVLPVQGTVELRCCLPTALG